MTILYFPILNPCLKLYLVSNQPNKRHNIVTNCGWIQITNSPIIMTQVHNSLQWRTRWPGIIAVVACVVVTHLCFEWLSSVSPEAAPRPSPLSSSTGSSSKGTAEDQLPSQQTLSQEKETACLLFPDRCYGEWVMVRRRTRGELLWWRAEEGDAAGWTSPGWDRLGAGLYDTRWLEERNLRERERVCVCVCSSEVQGCLWVMDAFKDAAETDAGMMLKLPQWRVLRGGMQSAGHRRWRWGGGGAGGSLIRTRML